MLVSRFCRELVIMRVTWLRVSVPYYGMLLTGSGGAVTFRWQLPSGRLVEKLDVVGSRDSVRDWIPQDLPTNIVKIETIPKSYQHKIRIKLKASLVGVVPVPEWFTSVMFLVKSIMEARQMFGKTADILLMELSTKMALTYTLSFISVDRKTSKTQRTTAIKNLSNPLLVISGLQLIYMKNIRFSIFMTISGDYK